MINLREHQTELLERSREKLRSGCKSLLIQAPTGFGKTALSTFIINGVVSRGKKAAFIVPRQELAYQTSSALNEFSIPHSFIANGRPFYNRHHAHICTTGSLINKLHWIDPDLIVLDEVHYGAAQLDKIVKYYKGLGKTIIGLSATPSRLDGRGLGCWFDDMIEGPSVSWLIDVLQQKRYFEK
jgi:superfamily II DNA or RNA helicase